MSLTACLALLLSVSLAGCQTGSVRMMIDEVSRASVVEAPVVSDTLNLPASYARQVVDTSSTSRAETNETPAALPGDTRPETRLAQFETDVLNEPNAPLSIEEVLYSVANHYPLIEVGVAEIESADGKRLATLGEFDTTLSGQSISQPLGFYQNYQNGVRLNQPLSGGGEVYGGYQIGDGDFEPWYGERETNEGGEFKVGFEVPLLKNRRIDARRADVWTAGNQRDQIASNVEARFLDFQRFAIQQYWEWVAAGRTVTAQQQILKLAQLRVEQIALRLKLGDLPEIAQLDNDRFIAKRESELIKAERKLQKAAIKLSLFYRDGNGQPLIPAETQLPVEFPFAESLATAQVEQDIMSAIATRPEIAELDAARREALVDLNYAKNLTLPKVDVKGYAAQDVGAAASSKGDKTPFQLQSGVFAEIPLQRRLGIGKMRAAQGKLNQIEAKRRFVAEKITAQIRDAASGVTNAAARIERSQRNLSLSKKSLELGRIAFEAGDIDLIELNIYETSVADAQLQLIEAQLDYFVFKVSYDTTVQSRSDFNNYRQ